MFPLQYELRLLGNIIARSPSTGDGRYDLLQM
jgi:hypothetical protein